MTKKILLMLSVLSFMFVLTSCGGTSEESDTSLDEIAAEDGESSSDDFGVSEEGAEEEIEEFGSDEEVAEETTTEEGDDEFSDEEAFADEETEEIEEGLEEAETSTANNNNAPAEESFPMDSGEVNNRVTGINFLASSNGGTVEIKTDAPAAYQMRENKDKNQFIIDISGASLPDNLKRPYLMKDFDSAFGAINAYQNPGGSTARIVVQMKGSGRPVIAQEGNTLLVTASGMVVDQVPMDEQAKAEQRGESDKQSYNVAEAEKTERILGAQTLDDFLTSSGKFYGRPISIQTNDADIRDVINLIAEESGLNIVIADDVAGKISLKLRQVPWDQALVIVMRTKGLGYLRQGNVVRITTLKTLQAEQKEAKAVVDSQRTLDPLKVKVMPISYANVKDLEPQITAFLTTGRGKVVSDERTSSVIITDTAEVLQRVERLIKELDIPPAQVMIEGKIVEATENFRQNIGVNWSLSGFPSQVSGGGGVNDTAVNAFGSFTSTNVSSDLLAGSNGLFNFNIGTLDIIGNLDAALGLAQADNTAKIISSPRIVTINKVKSEISQKSEVISIQTQAFANNNDNSDSSNALVSAREIRTPVQLKLGVTPQITNEGSVILDVEVTRGFAGPESDPQTKARPVNERFAKTKVLVSNGQTAVIGGIYQSDENEAETGVPGLKDIPVVGWLFKQRSKDRTKNELLIFLTPRILNAKDQEVGAAATN